MEEKILKRNFSKNIRSASKSLSNLPHDMRIIVKNNEIILVNKFALAFYSPYVCTLLNQSSRISDTLILADFSYFAVSHLLTVINNGFSKSSNISHQRLDEVFDVAKILGIDVNSSNSCIESTDVQKDTDNMELCTEFVELGDDSTYSEERFHNNGYIKQEIKDHVNIKKELPENSDVKQEFYDQDYIKQELDEYWGIKEEDCSENIGVNYANTLDMELCSEYVEFGDTLTELEQLQQTPECLVTAPQTGNIEDDNQIEVIVEELAEQEDFIEKETQISSSTEEHSNDQNIKIKTTKISMEEQPISKSIVEPSIQVSESDNSLESLEQINLVKSLLETNVESVNFPKQSQNNPENLSRQWQSPQQPENVHPTRNDILSNLKCKINLQNVTITPKNIIEPENISNQIQQEKASPSKNLIKQSQNLNLEPSIQSEMPTENPSHPENKLIQFQKDTAQESLLDNSLMQPTTPELTSCLAEIQQLENSLEQISQIEDPVKQGKKASRDLDGIDNTVTDIKSKLMSTLMEIQLKGIKKEIIDPQEVEMPPIVNNPQIELTEQQSYGVSTFPSVVDKNQGESKIRNKRKRNTNTDESPTLDFFNTKLSNQKDTQKRKKIESDNSNSTKVGKFNPRFSGKLQNFVVKNEKDCKNENKVNTGIFQNFFDTNESRSPPANLQKLAQFCAKNDEAIQENNAEEYRCQLCNFGNKNLFVLKIHVIIDHFKDDLLQNCSKLEKKCLLCKKSFKKPFGVVQHLVCAHDQPKVILEEKGLNPLPTNPSPANRSDSNSLVENTDIVKQPTRAKPSTITPAYSAIDVPDTFSEDSDEEFIAPLKDKVRYPVAVAEEKEISNVPNVVEIDSDIPVPNDEPQHDASQSKDIHSLEHDNQSLLLVDHQEEVQPLELDQQNELLKSIVPRRTAAITANRKIAANVRDIELQNKIEKFKKNQKNVAPKSGKELITKNKTSVKSILKFARVENSLNSEEKADQKWEEKADKKWEEKADQKWEPLMEKINAKLNKSIGMNDIRDTLDVEENKNSKMTHKNDTVENLNDPDKIEEDIETLYDDLDGETKYTIANLPITSNKVAKNGKKQNGNHLLKNRRNQACVKSSKDAESFIDITHKNSNSLKPKESPRRSGEINSNVRVENSNPTMHDILSNLKFKINSQNDLLHNLNLK